MKKATVIVALMLLVSIAGPAAVTAQQIPPVADNFITELLSTRNFGTHDQLGITGLAGFRGETLMRFDLPPIDAGEVVSATLYLYSNDPGHGGAPTPADPMQVEARAVLGSWVEATVTWDTKPSVDSTVLDTTNVSGWEQWFSLDVTDLVKDWLDGSLDNHGIHLSALEDSSIGPHSKEHASEHPYLELVATVPYCGDGNQDAGETCDDGRFGDCDGCSSTCEVETDGDGDGYYAECNDCDDTDSGVNPGSPEVAGNGIDDDCDGLVDEDEPSCFITSILH